MSELDDALETVVMHKAGRMKKGLDPHSKYAEHIEQALGELGIGASDEDVKTFVAGGVDAMIFDVASLLGFTSNTRDHGDWASYEKRREMLRKIFPRE